MPSGSTTQPESNRARRVFQRNRWELGALGLVLVTYLAMLWMLPKDVFWSPDEGIRLIMARMLAAPAGAGPLWDYPGYRLDPGYEFHPNVFNQYVLYPRIRADAPRAQPLALSLLTLHTAEREPGRPPGARDSERRQQTEVSSRGGP